MQLSILIPVYNSAHLLPDTLEPLLDDPATGEIVVVDDGSQDDSLAVLESIAAHDPRLRPISSANRGRGRARQLALEQSKLDVVLLLDADVVGAPGLVSGHAAAHEAPSERVVVGHMPPRPAPRGPGAFVIDLYAKQYEAMCAAYERDCRTVLRRLWGGNVSVPREALLRAGGCDAGAGVGYHDDLELGLRLEALGLEPVFDRRLVAEHRFARTPDGFLATARQQGRDLVAIDRLHPGRVELPRWREAGAGGALRRFARRRRGYAAIASTGRRLLDIVGRSGPPSAEARLGEFLERIEIQRGMLDQAGR